MQEIDSIHEDLSASRYIAYVGIAARAARYLAFTSDVGEAFRPVISRTAVRATYGISWLYCIGDVVHESRKASKRGVEGTDLARFATERAVFQAVASMGVPAFLIHSTVNVMKKVTAGTKYARWGPSACGLAVIPFLPVFLDEPAEKSIEWVFHKVWPSKAHQH